MWTTSTCTSLTLIVQWQNFISYPIQNGQFLNCVATLSYPEMNETLHDEPWVSAASRDELLDSFEGWTNDVQTMLSVSPRQPSQRMAQYAYVGEQLMERPSKWVVNCVSSLPTYVSRRVALMGDAVSVAIYVFAERTLKSKWRLHRLTQ